MALCLAPQIPSSRTLAHVHAAGTGNAMGFVTWA
jgi:hypothetical protein